MLCPARWAEILLEKPSVLPDSGAFHVLHCQCESQLPYDALSCCHAGHPGLPAPLPSGVLLPAHDLCGIPVEMAMSWMDGSGWWAAVSR